MFWRVFTGAPVNSFELMKPIVEGVGYTMPQREISVKSAMTLAWCIYAYYGLLYPWLQRSWIPEPLILPTEVFKVSSRQIFTSRFNHSPRSIIFQESPEGELIFSRSYSYQ